MVGRSQKEFRKDFLMQSLFTVFIKILTQLTFTCSKSTTETLEKGTFIVTFEYISYLFLKFPWLTLNKKILAGNLFLVHYSYLSPFLEKIYSVQNHSLVHKKRWLIFFNISVSELLTKLSANSGFYVEQNPF